MDNDHGITDELREWFDRYTMRKDVYDELTAIADRIDAEHERLMQEQPFTIDMVPITDENMAKHGWVRLPKDADGEYIHIGDVMEWCDSGETLTVDGIGSDVLFYIDGENAEWTAARNKRHHHEPTVEDVLFEFAQEMYENMGMYTSEAIDAGEWRAADGKTIAKYAAKLRLAGDAE